MIVNESEADILILYAFRYALGRATYAVSEMCSLIRYRWPDIPIKTKKLILRELEEAVRSDRKLGHDCDRSDWANLLENLKEKA